MRLQWAMLLAAAVFISSADASASTNMKPIQTRDAPFKRLLRSPTPADDDDGQERSSFAAFANNFKSGLTSSVGKLKPISKKSPLAEQEKLLKSLEHRNDLLSTSEFQAWYATTLAAITSSGSRKTPNSLIQNQFKDGELMAMITYTLSMKHPRGKDIAEGLKDGMFYKWRDYNSKPKTLKSEWESAYKDWLVQHPKRKE